MSISRAWFPYWLVDSGEWPELVAGDEFNAALEWWIEEMDSDVVLQESTVALDRCDLKDPERALYEVHGEVRSWAGEGWFLATEDLPIAVQGLSAQSIGRPRNGERVRAIANLAVAPDGTWAYWPPADALRRWRIDRLVSVTDLDYLIEISLVGPAPGPFGPIGS